MSSQDNMVLIGSSTLHSPQQIARLEAGTGRPAEHHSAAQQPRAGHSTTPCCWPTAPSTALSKPINHRKLLHALLLPRRYARAPCPRRRCAAYGRSRCWRWMTTPPTSKLIAAVFKGDGDRGGGVQEQQEEAVNLAQTSRSTSSSWISRCPSWTASRHQRSAITPSTPGPPSSR